MFQDHRIVIVTPAGRRAYLSMLIPQVLDLHYNHHIVDEYQLWVNTSVPEDIDYMKQAAADHPNVIKLRFLPEDTPAKGNNTIPVFFPECTQDKTVYVRFDDDVVYLDTPEAFKGFLDFRINNPEYFLVFGNILNNAIIAHILQRFRKLDTKAGIAGYFCGDPIGWKNGNFVAHLHDQVLDTIQQAIDASDDEPLKPFRFDGEWFLHDHERVSINCIAWIGDHFKTQCGGIIDDFDEEQDLSTLIPRRLKLYNTIYGNFCVVHYAFCTQREHVDNLGYEAKYRAVVEHKLLKQQTSHKKLKQQIHLMDKATSLCEPFWRRLFPASPTSTIVRPVSSS